MDKANCHDILVRLGRTEKPEYIPSMFYAFNLRKVVEPDTYHELIEFVTFPNNWFEKHYLT
jgi:hypothetical protein